MILFAAVILVAIRVLYSLAEICYERDWPRSTWRGLVTALMLLFLCGTAFGQAYRIDIPIQTYGPNVPSSSGPMPQAIWVANSTVILCAHVQPASAQSYANCAATPITTFIDGGEGATCATQTGVTNKQLVQLPGTTCTNSAGVSANVGFWYAGGLVDYYVITAYGTYGPYTVSPGGGGGGAGTVSNFTSNSLSPIFTTSVTNPTTTPALSYALDAAPSLGFLGNCTGTTADPVYCVLQAGPGINLNYSGGDALTITAQQGAGFTGAITPPGSGTHFVIVPPATVTCMPGPPGSGVAEALCGTASGALYMGLSAAIAGFGNGGGVGDNSSQAIWTFPSLPSVITNPSHVTAIWLISTNATTYGPGITGGYVNNNFPSFQCQQGVGTPISVYSGVVEGPLTQVNELTGWNASLLSTITCKLYNNYSSPGLSITITAPNMLLGIWYTTDPAPSANTATLVNPCLTFDNINGAAGEIGVDPNCVFPASRIVPASVPLQAANTYAVGTTFLVNNGASPWDCTTGGGNVPVLCVVNGSGGYTSYSLGGVVYGQVTSASGTATTAHTFTAAFQSTPNCTAAALSNAGAWYWSTPPSTTSSGVITYANSGAQTFDVHCQGTNGAW